MLVYLETITSILTGFLGILVVFILLLSYKSNKYVNIYLILVIVIRSLRVLYISLRSDSFDVVLNENFSWLKPILLLIIPCFYLYVKTIIDNRKPIKIKPFLHFIYPILLCIIALVQSYFDVGPEAAWLLFFKINLTSYLFFYIVITTLLILNFYQKRNQDLLKKSHFKATKTWIFLLYVLFVLSLIRLLINSGIKDQLYVDFFITGSNLIFLLLFIKILVSPEILFGFIKLKHSLSKNSKEINVNDTIWNLNPPNITNVQDLKLTPLIENKIPSYIVEIEKLLQKNNLFRNPDYAISNLAKEMKLPLSHLSYLFKYHCKLSFVEFKNHHRILDALFLMETNFLDTKTLEGLSLHVGFATYNSFFIAFKKQTSYAPNEYLVGAKNQ